MGFIAIDCKKCGANLEVSDTATTYTCKYCRTVHERDYSSSATATPHSYGVMAERAIANSEFGKALQFIEQGLVIDPHNANLLKLEEKANIGLAALLENHSDQTQAELQNIQMQSEAEDYHLQARFILNELQANLQVYGSNSPSTGATPANVDLALQYIDRSLEYFPDNPVYLNLKALLQMEGKKMNKEAAELLEKAAKLSPHDINIQNNLQSAKTAPSCFIATAAYGSPLAAEVHALRQWRDDTLLLSKTGRNFVRIYYRFSPPLARLISQHPRAKQVTRWVLTPLVRQILDKAPSGRT